MKSLLLLPWLIAAALASPVERRQSSSPTVTVSAGKIVGKSFIGVESFNGIPFAQPPVGPLRLKPPQPYTGQYPGGTFDATGTARSCPQQQNNVNMSLIPANLTKVILPLFDNSSDSSEDCLLLNVQRPAGTTAGAKLPVLFYIYGGGFEGGSISQYDASQIILAGTNGTAKNHPFVFVAVNYRLSAFGFLAGKELQKDGSTNLGLRDQRLGMQWVADNIAAFGGDPTRVTIWGESAGSISVNDQLLINNGDNTYKSKPLFKAAIMDSGTVIPALQVSEQKPQDVYNAVVKAAGCSGASDTLACLRSVPYATFKAASDSLPGAASYQSLNLSYLPRPDNSSTFFSTSPEAAVQAGRYVKVPMIAGDQEDEGTLFSQNQGNITNNEQLQTYLESYFPTSANLIPGLLATYPDDPAAGSPFDTGDFNNIYPEYKRLAAILGDFAFTLMRRVFLLSVDDSIPRWSYLDTHLYGTPILGTFHGTDVLASYYGLGALPSVVNTFRNAVISMVYYDDPNTIVDLKWPQWKADNSTGRQLLEIRALDNKVIKDDFRYDSFAYILAHANQIQI